MIEGEFPKPDSEKKRCKTHPQNLVGTCGFWLGHEHTWAPDIIRDMAYERVIDDANLGLEVLHWIRSHQEVGEHIVSLNKAQYKHFLKEDFIGVVELPMYVKEPSGD